MGYSIASIKYAAPCSSGFAIPKTYRRICNPRKTLLSNKILLPFKFTISGFAIHHSPNRLALFLLYENPVLRYLQSRRPIGGFVTLLFGICNPEELSADLQSAQNTFIKQNPASV
jgi:hypothetical protein